MRGDYMPEISQTDMASALTLYPADPAEGSPFDTGFLNALTPQFKRLAAIQGDLVFQAPRRFFLEHTSGKQPTWAFCEYTSPASHVTPLTNATIFLASEQTPEGSTRSRIGALQPNACSIDP